MQVRMLESVVAERKQHRQERSHPIIGMIGTRRLQLSSFLRIASRYDPDTYSNTGPFAVLSCMDGGLPSTHGDTGTSVEVALGIL